MLNKLIALFSKATSQIGGENSTNYQANKIIVRASGLSVADAKEIALMVVEQNFIKFSEQARLSAKVLMKEMIDDYLAGLVAIDPRLISEVQNPGVQMVLVDAQKEYVKSGDKDLEKLLVGLLVERTALQQRNLLRITLDESISVIGKLTNNQLDAILLNFLLKHVQKTWITSLADLSFFCDNYLQILIPNISDTEKDSTHIVTCNCALIVTQPIITLAQHWRTVYAALFSKGFEKEEAEIVFNQSYLLISQKYPGLFIQSLYDKTKIQVGYMDINLLQNNILRIGFNDAIASEVKALFNKNMMSVEEVHAHLLTFGGYMNRLFELWDNKLLSVINLTNIGQAIAITSHKKRWENEHIEYSTWI